LESIRLDLVGPASLRFRFVLSLHSERKVMPLFVSLTVSLEFKILNPGFTFISFWFVSPNVRNEAKRTEADEEGPTQHTREEKKNLSFLRNQQTNKKPLNTIKNYRKEPEKKTKNTKQKQPQTNQPKQPQQNATRAKQYVGYSSLDPRAP